MSERWSVSVLRCFFKLHSIIKKRDLISLVLQSLTNVYIGKSTILIKIYRFGNRGLDLNPIEGKRA